jgi:class 3 adenylate cyclase/tetratricopeptide (TPR) repeat protein
MIDGSEDKPSDIPLDIRPSGTRLHLTLLFLDLSGSSLLAEQLEAEEIAEILAATRDICRQTVARHGGQVARVQGDGALAVFGYPFPGENDGRRAAEAALEVHHLVEELDFASLSTPLRPLRMHSGIHSGLVLVSEGDIERGRFELVGDAPNTAARLASFAPAGAILANTESLGPQSNFFNLGSVEVRQLPGRSAAIRTVQILGRSGVDRRFDASARRGLTPFVGRRKTLEAIAGVLQATASSMKPKIVQLKGEAGVGKTRLLEEIADCPDARKFRCLRGYCESYLGAEVLQPFAQIHRSLLDIVGPLNSASSVTPPPGLTSQVLKEIAALATRQPILLLLDDWQWADDACRQLLDDITKLDLPIAIITAARPGFEGSNVIQDDHVSFLSPFTESETQSTVVRWLPGADPFIAAEIHQYAGGVPLLVEELCHAFKVQGTIGLLGALRVSGARVESSGWLSTVVASRLERLPARQQHLVRVAAVLGTIFPRWLFDRVLTHAVADDEIAALAEADFVFPAQANMLRFKHGLTRDAVFDTVGLQDRTSIHRRVVAVLVAESDANTGVETLEALAYHTRAAALWTDTQRYGELAGDKATQAFAFDRARVQYLAAIDAFGRRGTVSREETLQWCALVHKLGMTCIFDPLALPDALPLFERCLNVASGLGDTSILARSEYWMGYMCYGFGLPREAARHCREAHVLAQVAGDHRLAAQVEATLGQALAAACEYDEALPLMDHALSSKGRSIRAGSGVAVGSAFTLACKASVLADRGLFTDANEALDKARQLLGNSAHPVTNSVRNWSMVILAWQARWDDAIVVADEALRDAERSRALLPLAISRAVGGYARWMRDGTAENFEQIVEAIRWMELRSSTFFTSIYYGWLVEGCVIQNRFEESRRYAARLFSRARAGESLGESAGCRALARACQVLQDDNGVARYLRLAVKSAERRGSRRDMALNNLCRSDLLRIQGLDTEADEYASLAFVGLEEMGMTWYLTRHQLAAAKVEAGNYAGLRH